MTTRIAVVVSAALTAFLIHTLADASLQTRQRHSLHDAHQPRIVSVYTKQHQLFIAGRNLPAGEGVQVRLGDELLPVLKTSRSLLIAGLLGAGSVSAATGVHAAAVIKAQRKGDAWLADRIYSGVPASWIGREQEIEIGPMSGLSNVNFYLSSRDLPNDHELAEEVLTFAKKSNRTLTEEEILEVVHAHKKA